MINKDKTILKNKYISVKWEDDFLNIYDSDDNYFNYIIYGGDFDKKEIKLTLKLFKSHIKRCKTDEELCDLFVEMFFSDIRMVTKFSKEICEKYGEEFVNRIGSRAIISKE